MSRSFVADSLYTRFKEIYLHEPYEQDYSVSAEYLENRISSCDTGLKDACQAAGIDELQMPEWKQPEISLHYSEVPDESLTAIADRILDGETRMVGKIRRFIRQNNIYGSAYQNRPGRPFRLSEDEDYVSGLEKVMNFFPLPHGKISRGSRHPVGFFF